MTEIKRYTSKEIHNFAFSKYKNEVFILYETHQKELVKAEQIGFDRAKEIAFKAIGGQ